MNGSAAPTAYLTTQVMTATPQRLHLMLIEGATRFCRQAQQQWQQEQPEAASASLSRCQAVLEEMLMAVRSGTAEASRKLAGIYVFVFRLVAEAQLLRQPDKLAEAIRILDIERETWTLVCQRFGSVRAGQDVDGGGFSTRV